MRAGRGLCCRLETSGAGEHNSSATLRNSVEKIRQSKYLLELGLAECIIALGILSSSPLMLSSVVVINSGTGAGARRGSWAGGAGLPQPLQVLFAPPG